MLTTNTEPAEAVTVDVEALWLLQAILDIPTLPPELRSLPYGPARTKDWLRGDPRVDALQRNGLVDADHQVTPALRRRLQALAVPDVEIAILVSHGEIAWPGPIDVADPETWKLSVPQEQLSVVLARRDGRWVSGVRGGEHVTIDDVEGAAGFAWVADILTGLFTAFVAGEPSRMVAMNLPFDDLRAAAQQRAGIDENHVAARDLPLRSLGVPPAAMAELSELIDGPTAEAVVYARAHTDSHTHTSGSTLDVRATPAGRVVLYRMPPRPGATQDWMTIAPASLTQVTQGLQAVLGSLNVSDWAHHRRMG
jgi:EspG family